MDVFLRRQSSGKCVAPEGTGHLLLSEPLRAQGPAELEKEIVQLRKRRVRFVSVRRQQVLRLGRKHLCHILSSTGIQVGAVGYAGGFTGTLGPGYDASVKDTQRALELAAELGARSLVILPGSRGRHTWNHSSRTIRAGLERCLDDALRYRIDMQVALNTVLGGSRDVYRPHDQRPLDWIADMGSHRIRGLMVLRGPDCLDQMPDCWRRNLLSGGILRLSRRCCEIASRSSILASLVRALNQPLPARTESREPVAFKA